jgi:hypothetical protein
MALSAGTVAIITVLIYNPAAIPSGTLARAQKVAAGILAQAGVALEWRLARAADALPAPAEVPLHLLAARPPRLQHDAGGFAVLQLDPANSYAGISYPAVLDTAESSDAPVPTVLGAVLAHEIGHVLLRSGAHSPSGVMSLRMGPREIAAAGRGELRFTAVEALAIRAEAVRRAGSFSRIPR